MVKQLLILLGLLLMSQFAMSQSKTRADRFFEKGDYINAAKYYEEEIDKGRQKKSIENIAISYYNTFQYRQAYRYLNLLVNGKFKEVDKSYDNRFNFMAYQVLSALGDYETGLDFYGKYKENVQVALNKNDAIETIESFKLMNADYTVKSVSFNTESAEFGAVKVNDRVYFTSDRDTDELLGKKYKWTHRPFLDIYSVRVNDRLDTIGILKALPKEINSRLHEGNFCFSKNGATLYVSRSSITDGKKEFDDKDNNNVHLYRSSLLNGEWTKLEKLSFNKTNHSYQHPALSPDGTKLYFSSDQEGGMGGFDLYYVEVNPDSFGEPVNLGATINTPNREHFPFISDEGHLFFSSNGHLGLGMLDNFVSEWVGDNFSEPNNLGAPINSEYDDFNLNYFNESEGFFASNRKRANDDIYKFDQIGDIFIREYNNIFEVRDVDTKEFVSDVSVTLLDMKEKEVYTNTLDSIARFNKNLLSGNYTFKAEGELYRKDMLFINVKDEQDQRHILFLKKLPPPSPVDQVIAEKGIDKEMEAEDPERFKMLTDVEGPPIVEKDGKLFFELKPIYFDFDMWNIRADSRIILDELAMKLERFPNIQLKINSHTDSRGTDRYNQLLSERRAESTRNYLALEGYVNARRMKFAGYGESDPKVDCPTSQCTEEEHQLNRRSAFEIVEY